MQQTNIYIMRHGESEANKQKRISIDLGLSELGREQAHKRVKEFKSKDIDVVYSSNLKRAFETAEIIAQSLSKTVQIEPGFAERDYGEWMGLSNVLYRERLKDKYPVFDSLSEEEKLDYRFFPTYENNREMMNRFVPAINKVVQENEGKNILIVAHSSIVRMFLIYSKCVTRGHIPIEAIKNTGYVRCVYENGTYLLKDAVDVEILEYNSIMKTIPLYLEDSYIKEMDATVLEVLPEGEGRWRLLLDKTVFYPMGGGQPTDQGTLSSEGWTGNVYQVLMKDGEIWHYIDSSTEPIVGTQIHGTINWDRRFKNMRVHSAGHVIDFALYLLGYSPKQLVPTKGDHGKKPFILYTGILGNDISKELEDKSNELVQKGLSLTTQIVSFEVLEKEAIYLQPGLPTNKPLRKLTLEGIGSVADGGTQVKNTSEVGKITITSYCEKEGITTVTYSL